MTEKERELIVDSIDWLINKYKEMFPELINPGDKRCARIEIKKLKKVRVKVNAGTIS